MRWWFHPKNSAQKVATARAKKTRAEKEKGKQFIFTIFFVVSRVLPKHFATIATPQRKREQNPQKERRNK